MDVYSPLPSLLVVVFVFGRLGIVFVPVTAPSLTGSEVFADDSMTVVRTPIDVLYKANAERMVQRRD
jgi:hypothetical protein